VIRTFCVKIFVVETLNYIESLQNVENFFEPLELLFLLEKENRLMTDDYCKLKRENISRNFVSKPLKKTDVAKQIKKHFKVRQFLFVLIQLS
jgi:hypothetical protein